MAKYIKNSMDGRKGSKLIKRTRCIPVLLGVGNESLPFGPQPLDCVVDVDLVRLGDVDELGLNGEEGAGAAASVVAVNDGWGHVPQVAVVVQFLLEMVEKQEERRRVGYLVDRPLQVVEVDHTPLFTPSHNFQRGYLKSGIIQAHRFVCESATNHCSTDSL